MPTWLWAERNIGAAAEQEPVRARDVLEGWRRSARHLGARHWGRRRCSPTGARRGAPTAWSGFGSSWAGLERARHGSPASETTARRSRCATSWSPAPGRSAATCRVPSRASLVGADIRMEVEKGLELSLSLSRGQRRVNATSQIVKDALTSLASLPGQTTEEETFLQRVVAQCSGTDKGGFQRGHNLSMSIQQFSVIKEGVRAGEGSSGAG